LSYVQVASLELFLIRSYHTSDKQQGYGGYKPKPGIYQGLASFEAIFGTFMWAALIATSAREYMQ